MDFLRITEIAEGKCIDCGAELAYSGRAASSNLLQTSSESLSSAALPQDAEESTRWVYVYVQA